MSFTAKVAPILILWTMMKMHGNDGDGIVSKGQIDSDCLNDVWTMVTMQGNDGIVSKGRRRDLQTTPICPRGRNLKWRPDQSTVSTK